MFSINHGHSSCRGESYDLPSERFVLSKVGEKRSHLIDETSNHGTNDHKCNGDENDLLNPDLASLTT
jgi:hypothetical protein